MIGFIPVIVLLVVAAPLILMMFYFNVAAFSFAKLGLSPAGGTFLFALSLIGGVINIPIQRRIRVVETRVPAFGFIFYYPPRVRESVLAVNVGGAVIPVLFSLYLLSRAPLGPVLGATAIVTWVSKSLAKPVQGVGIAMPAFVPPLVAAGASLILAREAAAPVAYISGVLGTLIGADLLNLRRLGEMDAQVMSIGGAGVFDGIFLVGVIAALLS